MRVLGLVTLLGLLGGCTADLRPSPLDARSAALSPESARQALLEAALVQHSEGAAPWLSLSGVEVVLLDSYQGLSGWYARPWPSNPQPLTLRFRPGRDDGWLSFESDGEREAWGVIDWNTWIREGDGPPEWGQDVDVAFWVPTLAYFLELPFRVGRDAQITDEAGVADYEGERCRRVYVTWGSYEPSELDQYLVWIRERDGRIVRFDFTVREVFDFVQATARYDDFREVGGYLLPHRVEIGDAPPDDTFHVIEVERWTLPISLPDDELAPGGAPPPRQKPS